VSLPALLLVARTRYELPLSPSLARKFEALRERFSVRVLATAADGRARDDGTFRLVGRLAFLDGLLFYALLPGRVRRIVREHRPVAIVTQSPYEAALVHLARTGVPVVVELHGDWRTATRLYGSPLRRALSPAAVRNVVFDDAVHPGQQSRHRIALELVEAVPDAKMDFLGDIGAIQASAQALAEKCPGALPQPRAQPFEQVGQGLLVPLAGIVQQTRKLAVVHGDLCNEPPESGGAAVAHESKDASRARALQAFVEIGNT